MTLLGIYGTEVDVVPRQDESVVARQDGDGTANTHASTKFRTRTNSQAPQSSRGLIAQSTPSNHSKFCQDDPTYLSLFSFPCLLHKNLACQDLDMIGYTTAQELQDLLGRCPKSCQTCDTSRSSFSPSMKPPGAQMYAINSAIKPLMMPPYAPLDFLRPRNLLEHVSSAESTIGWVPPALPPSRPVR